MVPCPGAAASKRVRSSAGRCSGRITASVGPPPTKTTPPTEEEEGARTIVGRIIRQPVVVGASGVGLSFPGGRCWRSVAAAAPEELIAGRRADKICFCCPTPMFLRISLRVMPLAGATATVTGGGHAELDAAAAEAAADSGSLRTLWTRVNADGEQLVLLLVSAVGCGCCAEADVACVAGGGGGVGGGGGGGGDSGDSGGGWITCNCDSLLCPAAARATKPFTGLLTVAADADAADGDGPTYALILTRCRARPTADGGAAGAAVEGDKARTSDDAGRGN